MEIEEAKRLWTERMVGITETETLPLFDCCGRVAAEDIFSEIDVPSFPRSAMDGYAVRSSELEGACSEKPAVLSVAGEIDAGDVPEHDGNGNAPAYPEKTAVRIMTGGMIPEGFDAVVKQENTDYGETKVSIYRSVPPFMNYCPVGENFGKGALLVKKGELFGRAAIGTLAAAGIDKVKAVRKPRLAIINTGSELLGPGEKPEPGKIYSSIGAMLRCAAERSGAETVLLTICPDDRQTIIDTLKKAIKTADIVITTGGVSVGKKDLIPDMIEGLGGNILFRRVNIQPGTPSLGAMVKGKPVLALSGNPYAALVNFDIYFYAALSKLTGCKALLPKEGVAVMQNDYKKQNFHRRFIRAKVCFGKVETEADNRSSVISNMAECNCYADIPAGTCLKAGDEVRIMMMPG